MKTQVVQTEATKGSDAAKPAKTLFQTEDLRIGQRGEYIGGETFVARCKSLGVKCWVMKRHNKPDAFTKNLRAFINVGGDYEHVYGITYNGKDYDCGDMPRDLGKVVRGIAIATGKTNV